MQVFGTKIYQNGVLLMISTTLNLVVRESHYNVFTFNLIIFFTNLKKIVENKRINLNYEQLQFFFNYLYVMVILIFQKTI